MKGSQMIDREKACDLLKDEKETVEAVANFLKDNNRFYHAYRILALYDRLCAYRNLEPKTD
jgi:hypothetical protein